MNTSAALPARSQRATIDGPSVESLRISGVFQTSPGLLRRRLMGPLNEGLLQYLALRVGDVARAREAYITLGKRMAELPPDELLATPGPQARVYQLAREVAEVERAMPGFEQSVSLPWRAGVEGYRLREELLEDEAELLELAHARELSLEEMAFVLSSPPEDVERRLDQAEAQARKILGGRAPDPVRRQATVYVEAFALHKGWKEELLPFNAFGSEADAGLSEGTLIGGRYRIGRQVGVGAFGEVYVAQDDEVPGHKVALKLLRQPALSASARQAALRELRLNAAVFHPSLVQFKDHGWFEQRLWFVMPWYEGDTLEQRMARGALTRAEAKDIFVPLARALSTLHAAGIRHQDIKPENILLAELREGEREELLPVLIDLGVAAEAQEGLLGGTPLYFAPEVARRYAAKGHLGPDVNTAADVFALALSLRNALEPATQEDVPAGAIDAFISRRGADHPALPEARDLRYLASSFERWMNWDPESRPSAAELARQLEILTAPEQTRARRLGIARWLSPLLLALATIFGTTVYLLNHRAAVQEVEAHLARSAEADARAEVLVARAGRRAMEQDRTQLLHQIEEGSLSRDELTGQLATTQVQVGLLERDLSQALQTRQRLDQRIRIAADTERDLDTSLALAQARAATEEERNRSLDAQLGRMITQSESQADQIETLQLSRRDLRARLDTSTAARRQAESAIADLNREIDEARIGREEVQRDLRRVRVQIARLHQVLNASARVAGEDEDLAESPNERLDAPEDPSEAALTLQPLPSYEE